MAEFALGLTKTAVEGTVSSVMSAIDEEEELKDRVRNDLVFITGEFQMMQSFLNDANKERAKNEVARTWVRQIRDLTFDVEDCVEHVVNLDIKSYWSWLWRMLPDCMQPPLALDEAVAMIQRLKARVEDVSQRKTRYNLIGDSGSSSNSSKHALFTTISSAAPELMLPASADVGASSTTFQTLREVWEAAGKMRPDMGDLKKLITNEGPHLEVISLWPNPGPAADLGLGLLGAINIIREIYNDPEICQKFKSRAWVKLMNPFNPDEFLKSLLTQFYANSHIQENVVEVQFQKKMKAAVALEDEFMQQWSQQSYLVIVEQLSTMVEWDAIKFYLRNSGQGSRIVVATQWLGLALCCTGKPYQVSELGQFYDGQSLCVFFKKVSERHSDMGELIWQLRHGGVISLWDTISCKSTLVNKVFNCITQNSKEWDGPKFDRHSWIDVPAPFDMGVFSRHLFLNFHSNDLRAQEIAEVSKMGEEAIIHRCCKILREDNCLIVINGLKSTGDWDLIKTTFLLMPTESCILVLGKDACVATYCVDEKERAFKIEDLEADLVLRHTIKACEYIGIGGKEASNRGRFFSNRREEACVWMNKFKHGVPENEVYNALMECLYSDPGVICLCGTTGAGKSALARRIYYNQMLIVREDVQEFCFFWEESFDFGFTKYSWIDVPHPFNLKDLCWRLLLDFHSDDLHDKDTVALSMMDGHQDPIEGCLKFLRQDKCFIVIDGLRSTGDWDLIKVDLLSEPTKGCILVITNEASVATHCVEKDRVINVKGPEADVARHPLIKNKWSLHQRSRVFSSRMVQARDWITKFELIGHDSEWSHLNGNLRKSSPCVIAIWGIAGVGKSALVRSFYYKNLIGLRQFFTYIDCGFLDHVTKYSWVDVPHPFNLRDLSRRLLLDFHSDDLDAKEIEARGMMEGLDPIQGCRKFMRQDKCFVVIDGLRSTDDWDFIKTAFLSEPIKGCILVITNDKTVAKHCVDEEGQVINVKGLEANAALNLFTKVASGGKQLSPKQIDVSKLTMTKCGGLPKVIAAIGEQCIASQRGITFLENLNSNFMGTLENMPEFHSLGGLFSWIESYFDACPDALKPCIFYLSVFPADYGIRRRRLLRRWIAEGYSRDKFGISAEKDGENLFYELVKLSIIQISREYMNRLNEPNSKVDKKKKNVFQVNSFIHGYIISRQLEDNLVFALEGHCKLNSQRAGQHLTIRSSWDGDEIVFKSMDLSRLRSLTVFGEWKSFFISTADSSNMSLLRVLDLEDTTSGVTDGVLEKIGKLLPRLKFLSVRGCKDITCLPDSLGGLRQLQTLDVRHTYIVKLPLAIMKLHKLQYIRAGTTHEPLDQGHDTQPPAPADHDGTSTNQTAAAVAANGEATSTSQTAAAIAANGEVASTSQPAAETPPVAVDGRTSTTLVPWRRKARNLVESYSCSWSSKKKEQRRRQGLNGGGVEVPVAGIGNLTALHTLGVVRVSGAGGKDILKEVEKLTQLHKLGVSGINWKNWHDLCSAISNHNHLESLSVRLDKDEQQDHLCCLGDISSPPKTLKSLKLYGGNVHVSVVWMKQLGDNLIKAHFQDLELIISTQEDIDSLIELPFKNMFRHLCLKPIQDGELHYDRLEAPWPREAFNGPVLRIDCSSYRLAIVFGGWIPTCVEVLVVHCSTSAASLEVSGLEKLCRLKEVWLKGSYSDSIKQHLQQKVEEHEVKPFLKLDPQQLAPPTPCACLKPLLR